MIQQHKKIRFFFDTEFNENAGRFGFEPISIALVPEKDDEPDFYAISRDFNEVSVNPWVRENVIKYLPPPEARISNAEIRDGLEKYFKSFPLPETVEIWGHNMASDQVILAQFFGGLTEMRALFKAAGVQRLEFRDTKEPIRATGEKLPPPENAHDCHVDALWSREEFRQLSAKLSPERKFLIE